MDSNPLLNGLIDALDDVIWAATPEGELIHINQACHEVYGYDRSLFLSAPDLWHQVIHPEDRGWLCAQRPRTGTLTYRIVRADGIVRWVRDRRQVVHDETGQVVQVGGIVTDITEQKQHEEALRRTSERLDLLRQIDRAILSAQSPVEIAAAALSQIERLVPCIRATVATFDGDEAHLMTVLGPDVEARIGRDVYIPLEHLGVYPTVSAGQINVVDDIDAFDHRHLVTEAVRAEGVRSFVNLPLVYNGQVIGKLSVGAAERAVYTEEHIAILRQLADHLAIAIQQSRFVEEIRRYTEELEERVQQRTASLEEVNERLRQLTRVKDEFVSNVSHELRTPITGIKLNQRLLQLNPEKHALYSERIGRETERLSAIIEDLLQLSYLDRSPHRSKREVVNLCQLTEDFVGDRQVLADDRGINLVYICSETNLPDVFADPGLLGQVVSILLTNALNYTPPGGEVNVQMQVKGDDVGFRVADNGPGILPEEKEQIFERFFRGSAGQASGASGTGLGLSLAREIVTAHEGRIEVISEAGQGAAFEVWLPAYGDHTPSKSSAGESVNWRIKVPERSIK